MENKDVLKELFTQLFDKVGEGIRNEAKKPRSDYLAESAFPDTVSSKTFSRYYERYVEGKVVVVGVPSIDQLNDYAKYLEYDFYFDFEKKYGSVKPIESKRGSKKVILIIIGILILALIGFFLVDKFANDDTKECIFWVRDHYEQMPCENSEGLKNGIELNEQNRWENYQNKRALQFDRNSSFLDENGNSNVWYYYGQNGYEFFNFSGEHPVINETLKPVTQEFFDSYFGSEILPNNSVENSSLDSSVFEDDEIVEEIPEVKNEEDKPEEVLRFCELNNTGNICFKNLSYQPLLVKFFRLGNDPSKTQELRLNNVEKKCLDNFEAGTYKYSVYVSATNKLIEQSQFVLKQCDDKLLSFEVPKVAEKPVEIPAEVKKPPKCETEELGDFCFKNIGDQMINIVISDYHSNSPLSQRYLKLTLDAGEHGCYYDVPSGAYNVEYYDNGINRTHSKYDRIKIVNCETGEREIQFD
jgi:hypothetical protein